jgi:hypothetical protein
MIRSTGSTAPGGIASATAGGSGVGHQPPALLQEGNYATLSEASDEMYAAIEEDNVYMDPEGGSSGGGGGLPSGRSSSRGDVDDPSLMYSKVDKNRKRTLRRGEGGGASSSGYAMVNKTPGGGGSALRRSAAVSGDSSSYAGIGARQPLQQQAAAMVAATGSWRSSDSASYHYASAAVGRGANSSSPLETDGAGGTRPRLQEQR